MGLGRWTLTETCCCLDVAGPGLAVGTRHATANPELVTASVPLVARLQDAGSCASPFVLRSVYPPDCASCDDFECLVGCSEAPRALAAGASRPTGRRRPHEAPTKQQRAGMRERERSERERESE